MKGLSGNNVIQRENEYIELTIFFDDGASSTYVSYNYQNCSKSTWTCKIIPQWLFTIIEILKVLSLFGVIFVTNICIGIQRLQFTL